MDQLNIERAKRNVFASFSEGALDFPPTYKYQPGTDVYDQRPEKKVRPPAWCDRVLWQAPADNSAAQLLSYRRSELNPSDHKPVSASFSLDLRVVVVEREQRAYKDLMMQLSQHRNSAIPVVEVDVGGGFAHAGGSSSQAMDFLGVRFMVSASSGLPLFLKTLFAVFLASNSLLALLTMPPIHPHPFMSRRSRWSCRTKSAMLGAASRTGASSTRLVKCAPGVRLG